MIDGINDHLSKSGKKMCNIKKASITQLNELIVKYNINMDEFVIKRKEAMIKEKKEKKERERLEEIENIERKRLRDIENKKIEDENNKIKETLGNQSYIIMNLQRNVFKEMIDVIEKKKKLKIV